MTLVHCEYFPDLRDILATRLVAEGFKVEADLDALLVQYLKVGQRRIQQRCRGVKWSSDLRAREATLSAPIRNVLAEIERASVAGDDLNPYLSRTLNRDKDADFNDLQFNDWGIKHLHLGDALEAPGVVKGTKELLFVIHGEEVLHFIDVGDHKDWADDDLFLIIESNWPELLADALLPGVSADTGGEFASGTFKPEDRLRLRRARIGTATVGATGMVYAPVGAGQMMDGTNFEVRELADRILDRVHRLEVAHKAQGDEIAAKIALKTGAEALPELCLKLLSVNANDLVVVVVETQSGQQVCSPSPS